MQAATARRRGAASPGARSGFDDNAGHDDAGALPVAVSESWSVDRGEHEIRFLAAKDDAGDADVTVSSPSLAVVCAKPALEP